MTRPTDPTSPHAETIRAVHALLRETASLITPFGSLSGRDEDVLVRRTAQRLRITPDEVRAAVAGEASAIRGAA